MGGACSSCTTAQVPQSIEENIFDILPRDPTAPDDLFKPLDVHFARNNTLSNLLALYPSRRLPIGLVNTIWRHYFEYFLIDAAAAQATSQAQLSARNSHRTPRVGISPSSPSTPSSPANPNANALGSAKNYVVITPDSPVGTGSGGEEKENKNGGALLDRTSSFGTSSQSKIGAGGGLMAASSTPRGAPKEEHTQAEITCMQWFVTDVLRHDLACLKERYDEVLAASLSLPPSNSMGMPQGGFTFNPVPVLKAIRQELQRLNNMPIDYLARVLLKEMKGMGEEDELSSIVSSKTTQRQHARNSSLSVPPPTHQPHTTPINLVNHEQVATGVPLTTAVTVIDGTSPSSPTAPSNPLDKPISVPHSPHGGAPSSPIAPPSHRDLPAPPSARAPPPILSFERFSAHIDMGMKNLFDRYYRKGYWVMFSLNLVHNARKVTSMVAAPLSMVGKSPTSGLTGWSDRITHAMNQAQPIAQIKPRKQSISASSSATSGGPALPNGKQGSLSLNGLPAPPSRPSSSSSQHHPPMNGSHAVGLEPIGESNGNGNGSTKLLPPKELVIPTSPSAHHPLPSSLAPSSMMSPADKHSILLTPLPPLNQFKLPPIVTANNATGVSGSPPLSSTSASSSASPIAPPSGDAATVDGPVTHSAPGSTQSSPQNVSLAPLRLPTTLPPPPSKLTPLIHGTTGHATEPTGPLGRVPSINLTAEVN